MDEDGLFDSDDEDDNTTERSEEVIGRFYAIGLREVLDFEELAVIMKYFGQYRESLRLVPIPRGDLRADQEIREEYTMRYFQEMDREESRELGVQAMNMEENNNDSTNDDDDDSGIFQADQAPRELIRHARRDPRLLVEETNNKLSLYDRKRMLINKFIMSSTVMNGELPMDDELRRGLPMYVSPGRWENLERKGRIYGKAYPRNRLYMSRTETQSRCPVANSYWTPTRRTNGFTYKYLTFIMKSNYWLEECPGTQYHLKNICYLFDLMRLVVWMRSGKTITMEDLDDSMVVEVMIQARRSISRGLLYLVVGLPWTTICENLFRIVQPNVDNVPDYALPLYDLEGVNTGPKYVKNLIERFKVRVTRNLDNLEYGLLEVPPGFPAYNMDPRQLWYTIDAGYNETVPIETRKTLVGLNMWGMIVTNDKIEVNYIDREWNQHIYNRAGLLLSHSGFPNYVDENGIPEGCPGFTSYPGTNGYFLPTIDQIRDRVTQSDNEFPGIDLNLFTDQGNYGDVIEEKMIIDRNNNNNNNMMIPFYLMSLQQQSITKINQENKEQDVWLLDSGASCDVTFELSKLTNIKKCNEHIIVGDGFKNKATRKGTVYLKDRETGKTIKRDNVFYLARFAKNILSVSKLINDGVAIQFNEREATLTRNSQSIRCKRNQENGMYYWTGWRIDPTHNEVNVNIVPMKPDELDEPNDEEVEPKIREDHIKETNKAMKTLDINLAHDMLGHKCESLLRQSFKLHGYKLTGKLQPCEGCIKAKARRKNIKKKSYNKSQRAGERWSVDLSGPYNPPMKQNKYVMTMMDEFSKFAVVTFMKAKSEVKEEVDKLLTVFQNKGYKYNYLRCDNAGENVSPLQSVCEKHGIALELTAPYTPQQNGMNERRSTTNIQRVHAQLIQANLSKRTANLLWAESLSHTNDIENISLNTTTDKTPLQLFSNKESQLYLTFNTFW